MSSGSLMSSTNVRHAAEKMQKVLVSGLALSWFLVARSTQKHRWLLQILFLCITKYGWIFLREKICLTNVYFLKIICIIVQLLKDQSNYNTTDLQSLALTSHRCLSKSYIILGHGLCQENNCWLNLPLSGLTHT